MTSPDSEACRATGSWSLVDPTGATTSGKGLFVITDGELASPSSDYRLAGRRLEPLKRLRAAKRDRISHDAAWEAKLSRIFGG